MIDGKETINEKPSSFLKRRGVVKVGSLKRFEIKSNEDSIELTDWTITRYYYKDGHVDENYSGCMICIPNDLKKQVAKGIEES